MSKQKSATFGYPLNVDNILLTEFFFVVVAFTDGHLLGPAARNKSPLVINGSDLWDIFVNTKFHIEGHT